MASHTQLFKRAELLARVDEVEPMYLPASVRLTGHARLCRNGTERYERHLTAAHSSFAVETGAALLCGVARSPVLQGGGSSPL